MSTLLEDTKLEQHEISTEMKKILHRLLYECHCRPCPS